MTINEVFELAIEKTKAINLETEFMDSKFKQIDSILYEAQGIIEEKVEDLIDREKLWKKLDSIQKLFEIENY